ncbi:hypothetical protein ACFVFJ_45885 [Streptomyces sp. NPDC057717]|uniref:hypothetical protein n=1 Tax=Streptomyces sp. NPDC057717 TaxID=3346224 RepID=UPI00368A1607
MVDWEDDEYCLYVNAREASSLWMILADWTQSEDEELWKSSIPRFAAIITCWQRLGFIKVFQAEEWPAHLEGVEISSSDLPRLLRDPRSWEYSENPKRVICIAIGDRDITELKSGMCEDEIRRSHTPPQ